MAVSEAGGLGSIPGALLTPETARAELIAIRSATQAPFNINFFCYDEPTPDAAQDAAWRRALRPYYEEFGIGDYQLDRLTTMLARARKAWACGNAPRSSAASALASSSCA